MAVLLSARELTHAFGARPLFERVSFTLSEGDRVGLIGPNGAGKSTLLKILAGAIAPDRGELSRRGGLRTAYLEQVTELPFATVREAVRARLPAGEHESEHEALVDEWLNRLELDADAPVAALSGGWQKRVALARALVGDPELLLLDEPTNHLDVESIVWLERFVGSARFATLTVTHDRLFLQRVSRRILELDRRNPGGLLDIAGDYATYVETKAGLVAAAEQRQQSLENTLRRETEWLRRGPSARSTKQIARIERAGSLADEVAELRLRNQSGKLAVDFQARDDEMRPKRLIEARGIAKHYGEKRVLAELDLFIGPRTRLGLIGRNGCGKSTLLRILTGREAATLGEVITADNLQIAYFEQDRASLDPKRTLADTVSPDGDFVHFRGALVHRHGYLERFSFRADQMAQPVGSLSGGEQSRLLIARLMLTPANVLVLDEPTNDLDLVSLAVLEQALQSFDGAVLLVTHDRYFMDRVASELLAFHTRPGEEGRVTTLADLGQWEAFHAEQSNARPKSERAATPERPQISAPKRKKLSFKDQRDYDTIEARIEAAEARVSEIEGEMGAPHVVSDAARLVALVVDRTAVRAEIDGLYARWAELQALVDAGG